MVTFRVESTNRWDALALAGKLARFRWYLIEPDDRHWHVCIPVEQVCGELPGELRRMIESWLSERRLEETVIHAGTDAYVITPLNDAQDAAKP